MKVYLNGRLVRGNEGSPSRLRASRSFGRVKLESLEVNNEVPLEYAVDLERVPAFKEFRNGLKDLADSMDLKSARLTIDLDEEDGYVGGVEMDINIQDSRGRGHAGFQISTSLKGKITSITYIVDEMSGRFDHLEGLSIGSPKVIGFIQGVVENLSVRGFGSYRF